MKQFRVLIVTVLLGLCVLTPYSSVNAEKEMNKTVLTGFVAQIQEIFSNYYRVLEEEVRKASLNTSSDGIKEAKARLEAEYTKFWRIPEFTHISNREEYFKKIQEHLREKGYFLDITPQYGIDT